MIRELKKSLKDLGFDRIEDVIKDNDFILSCYNTKKKKGLNLTIEEF